MYFFMLSSIMVIIKLNCVNCTNSILVVHRTLDRLMTSLRLLSGWYTSLSIFLILNCIQSTWMILSNHLLQLLYSVPSPCKHCLAVTDEVGISMTLGVWVEYGGGWSKQRRKIAFSTASRLALLLRSMNLRQWKCCCMR